MDANYVNKNINGLPGDVVQRSFLSAVGLFAGGLLFERHLKGFLNVLLLFYIHKHSDMMCHLSVYHVKTIYLLLCEWVPPSLNPLAKGLWSIFNFVI